MRRLVRCCLTLTCFPAACLHVSGGSKQGVHVVFGSPARAGWNFLRGSSELARGMAEDIAGKRELTLRADTGERAPWQPRVPVALVVRRRLSHVSTRVEGEDSILELDVAEARKLTSRMRRERQLDFSFPSAQQAQPEKPVVIKVFIDQEVRVLLKLAARERRGRILLDATRDTSLKALLAALENRFPIGAVPYRLQVRWQEKVKRDAAAAQGEAHLVAPRLRQACSVEDDAAVQRVLQMAACNPGDHIRLELHVLMSANARVKDERATPPELLALIASSTEWCMASFYSFSRIRHTPAVAEELQLAWSRMGIVGRTYVAHEGINAQLAVPDKLLPLLQEHITAFAHLRGARLNVDAQRLPINPPHPSPSSSSSARPPFDSLRVNVRAQIVVDGLSSSGQVESFGTHSEEKASSPELDWSDCGEEVDALQWHQRLKEKRPQEREVVLLDCRNAYESDVGKFEGAVPLNTGTFREGVLPLNTSSTFRDTWGALEGLLADKDPSNTEVMIYCTGGIRCVKVGAYLRQRMRFHNVSRLQGGIVAYVRELKERVSSDELKGLAAEKETCRAAADEKKNEFEQQSLFRGINYVFDNRIGQLVTADVPLHQLPSSRSTSAAAHTRLEGAEEEEEEEERGGEVVCDEGGRLAAAPAGPEPQRDMERTRKVRECIAVAVAQLPDAQGSCSQPAAQGSCGQPAAAPSAKEQRQQRADLQSDGELGAVEQFCGRMTRGWLAEEDEALLEELEQETLRHFPKVAHMSSGRLQASLLALLCQLSNAQDVLEIGTFTGYSALVLAASPNVRRLVTIERDPLAAAVARRYFSRAGSGKIQLLEGEASLILSSLATAAVAAPSSVRPFDLVFLDAGKRDYLEQRSLLVQHGLIQEGTLVVADNVLWAGAVPRYAQQLAEKGDADTAAAPPYRGINMSRQEKVTRALHDYCTLTAEDACWQQLVLPLRDGVSIARYVGAARRDASLANVGHDARKRTAVRKERRPREKD